MGEGESYREIEGEQFMREREGERGKKHRPSVNNDLIQVGWERRRPSVKKFFSQS